MLTLGILSGTSVDALDIALIDWQTPRPKLLAFSEFEWPRSIQTRLLNLPEQPSLSLAEYGQLSTAVGQVFAQTIQTFLAEQQLNSREIAVVGSHGQTIWHQPDGEQPFSLQIGHAAVIAKQTGIAVAADFRMDDIALCGQGAPLAPAFHNELFADSTTSVAVINLGGIANITLINPNQPTIGFDIGPANTLLDAWYRQHHKDRAYDLAGAWAATAAVDERLLNQLLAHPYFSQPIPKSTGRETFSLKWLEQNLTSFAHLSAAQVQSTILQLTVKSIAQLVQQRLPKGSLVWLAGGGVMNDELVKRLNLALADYHIKSTEQDGYPAAAIEAMLFAWLGKQRLSAQPINLTSITGSKKPTILGGLWLP